PYGEYQVGVNEILLENDFLSSFNLTNYDLLYGNDITFEVKRKDLVLNDNVFISVEATYTAEKIVPNIIFKDIDGNDMTDDFMPNYTQFNNQGTVVSMSVGGVLININEYDNYLGLISNSTIINNPNNVENKNVGYYWFNVYISANPNLSYNGMAMFKWMFKINKADLYMSTYDISNEIEAQITKTITYNGNDIVYPRYEIIYKGFKEKDLLYLGSNPIPAKGVVSIYTINGDNNYNDYGGFIDYIELINPIYTFVDEQNNELVEKPINVGRYKIKFLFSDVYGIAKNYNIILEDDFYDNKAPILEITPRPIDIMYDANNNSYITKKYDYYDNVVQGTVTTNNYTIISIDGVLNSGLKTGDEVYLNVNYEMSKYARSTVLDEGGKDTVIDVTIYAYTDLLGRSANNYMLYVSATNYTQGMFRYLLKGDITVADAYVDFYDFEDNIVNSQIDTEYNAEAQPIRLSVYGVKKKNGSYEDLFIDIDYIVTYLGDTSGYDSSEAPIICDKYVVEVQIQNSNYSSRTQSIIYFINKASVDIYFNGDSVQYFGDIIGLTAEANGKGNYVKNLQVTYYTYNDDTRGIEVKNIGLVGIGKYLVEAIHEETANFKYEVKFEILEIKYKDMYLNYDLSNKYTYSGMNQSFDIYYLYNDVKISPTLIVQKYINGEYKDYNTGTVFRLDVGKYRIKSVDLYSNFRLIGNNWIEFTVEKAKLSIFPKNTTIVENDDLLITPEIIGLLGSDTLSSAITNYNYLNVDFFDASTGAKLLDKPNSPGVYRMCYNNAESNNYYIQYQYGLLTINRSSINSDNLNDTDIILEGSFDKETEIVISKQNDSELNTFVQAFQSFKNSIDVNDEETDELLLTVKNYYLSEIYYINYINYTQSENDKITRIVIGFENGKVKKLSNNVIGAEENEIKYYVAYLDDNGTITVTEAIYSESKLSFDIDDNKKIVAFSVLSEVNNLEDNTEINNISWILYLSVGLALILILISVVIFIK
ncbi:MAG: hypothetical protein K5765_01255, partial [Clostridia bacterium]|nr:hypothetical protein [Clostridia bacterium]